MSKFKPLLTATAELDKIDFTQGLVASPKLDGIRCIIIDSVAMSRSLKPIPNKHIQWLLGRPELNGLDGEIICGDPTSHSCYRDTNSACMSIKGEPDIDFYVFDHIGNPENEYCRRLIAAQEATHKDPLATCTALPQVGVRDLQEMEALELGWLNEGYEGLMLRAIQGENSRYKFGRATVRSQTLLKVKRFADHDFRIVGFTELFHNDNVSKVNALGHTERSSHMENKRGGAVLGALILETEDGQRFQCGTGFDSALRAEIWAQRDAYMGKFAKVKHFEQGVKDLPRFPVFLGMRDPIDL